MTTKVTVDAHAGWDVLVVELVGEPSHSPKEVRQTTVPAYEKRDFYIHSGCRIISIQEDSMWKKKPLDI